MTTLYAHLSKVDGVISRRSSGKLREADRGQTELLHQAVALHQNGMKLEEIEARTGIKRATLYLQMRRQGGFMPRRRERGRDSRT